MKRAWLAVAIAAGCGGAPKVATEHSQQTTGELRAVTMFAIGPVGFAGTMSEGETATRELAGAADAVARFEDMAANGAPAPRLYAYWALRTLAPERAAAHDQAMRDDHREVETMTGCIRSGATVADLFTVMQRSDARRMPAPGTRAPDDPPPAIRGGDTLGM